MNSLAAHNNKARTANKIKTILVKFVKLLCSTNTAEAEKRKK